MATKVEELLQEINDVLEDTASSLDPSRHRDFIGLDDVLEQLISAAREEGAAEEREGVRIGSDFLQKGAEATLSNFLDDEFDRSSGRFVVITLEDCYIVPASLLAPDTKELTEDEKIARLAEIVQQTEEPEVTIITRAGSAPKEEK